MIYPLHSAAKNGHEETCSLLIDCGFDKDFVTEQGSALHVAAVHARVNVVKMLLKRGTPSSL
jgi:ankyrin repeat protein